MQPSEYIIYFFIQAKHAFKKIRLDLFPVHALVKLALFLQSI